MVELSMSDAKTTEQTESYQAPAIEREISPGAVSRESHYAGNPISRAD